MGAVKRMTFNAVDLQMVPGVAGGSYTPNLGVNESIYNNSIWLFPVDLGIYGMDDLNQIVLQWQLETMPVGATFVDVTPITFVSLLSNGPTSGSKNQTPGRIVTTLGSPEHFEFFRYTYDDLSTPNQVLPQIFAIRKTVADPAIGPVPMPFGTTTFAVGTVHNIPFATPYFGFLVQTDGADNSGAMTLTITVSWA